MRRAKSWLDENESTILASANIVQRAADTTGPLDLIALEIFRTEFKLVGHGGTDDSEEGAMETRALIAPDSRPMKNTHKESTNLWAASNTVLSTFA